MCNRCEMLKILVDHDDLLLQDSKLVHKDRVFFNIFIDDGCIRIPAPIVLQLKTIMYPKRK